MLSTELTHKIKTLISGYRVMLFMKGTPEEPQCGFSGWMAGILVESEIYFESFDIYSDEAVRQGLKEYSDWPTFPQLYIDGELIWGIDIVSEMYESWELWKLKEEKGL